MTCYKKLSKESSKNAMGKAGEAIVANWLIENNNKVIISTDQYDSEKDMIVNGKKIEVKTQVPFVFKNAFTIKDNQLRKCKSVDFVFFVSVPNKKKSHWSEGKVYRIESKKMIYKNYVTKDNRNMILIPIEQDNMEEMFSITKEQCNNLMRYSVSEWN